MENFKQPAEREGGSRTYLLRRIEEWQNMMRRMTDKDVTDPTLGDRQAAVERDIFKKLLEYKKSCDPQDELCCAASDILKEAESMDIDPDEGIGPHLRALMKRWMARLDVADYVNDEETTDEGEGVIGVAA